MNNQILKEIYYDPKNGYPSLNNLVKIVKDKGYNIPYQEIKNFYDNQSVNQIFKQNIKKKFEKIRSFYDDVGTLQVDLMDVNRWSKHNKGINYLLNIVDIYSRYAWSYPLKTKTPDEVKIGLKKTYDEIAKKYPNNRIVFEADNGSEFKGQVSKLNNDYEVEIVFNNPDKLNQHTFMSIVERFNRTLLNKIKKHIYSSGKLNYIDSLDSFINAYNNTQHSSTQMKPEDIFIYIKKVPIIINEKETNEKEDLQIGDLVRLVKKKKTFEKKSITPNLSTEIYKIVDIKGNKYKLQNINSSQPLNNLYIAREIVKIPDTTEIKNLDNIKQQIKTNDNENRTVRLNQKENIGKVNKETGKIEPENKRLKPKDEKRKTKKPDRYKPT